MNYTNVGVFLDEPGNVQRLVNAAFRRSGLACAPKCHAVKNAESPMRIHEGRILE